MNGKEDDRSEKFEVDLVDMVFASSKWPHSVQDQRRHEKYTVQHLVVSDLKWSSMLTEKQRTAVQSKALKTDTLVIKISPKVIVVSKREPRLEVAPGFRLHRWLSSWCPRSFKENILDELLATGTLMYQEALAQNDFKAARRIRLAMRFWMLQAVFGGFVTGAFMLLGQLRRKSE